MNIKNLFLSWFGGGLNPSLAEGSAWRFFAHAGGGFIKIKKAKLNLHNFTYPTHPPVACATDPRRKGVGGARRIAATLFLIFLCAPVFAAENPQIQILSARLESLQIERDMKIRELADCEKNVKGFRTAGLATLGATGVGIGVNIALAGKLAAVRESGGGGVARGGASADARSPEQVLDDNIAMLCAEFPDEPECN